MLSCLESLARGMTMLSYALAGGSEGLASGDCNNNASVLTSPTTD